MKPDEIEPLSRLIRERQPRLIAVDGMNGAGKTTRVAKRLGLPVISIDDFLLGNRRFLDGLRLDELRAAIVRQGGALVVEGCCVLEVLARVSVSPDLHVYVRRINAVGRWEDEGVGMGDDLEHQLRVLEEIREAAQVISGEAEQDSNRLHADLVGYHAQYRPFQRADLVLDLREDA